ncbi:MAG TPA: oligopeptide/dipeptide ABC transporter ATP-binding protein, partial [Streptosporangiaceae bacterium]|nr:oligopeptide/dipeptide ABC transporter ATP-binding protein [Streptosporangiaceae bacterium]
REFDTALIMITHDLGVIADIADDVLVMYAGKPVEQTDRRSLYYRPHHPYAKGLLESIPGSTGAKGRLKPIPGQPPSLINVPTGCSFHPRCAYVMDRCITDEPPLRPVGAATEGAGHDSACWLPEAALGLGSDAEQLRAKAVGEGRVGAAKQLAARISSDVKGTVAR